MRVYESVKPSVWPSYFKLTIDGSPKFLHKQKTCWILTHEKSSLSSNRLSRVRVKIILWVRILRDTFSKLKELICRFLTLMIFIAIALSWWTTKSQFFFVLANHMCSSDIHPFQMILEDDDVQHGHRQESEPRDIRKHLAHILIT